MKDWDEEGPGWETKMSNYLNEIRNDIKEFKLTWKCRNDTIGIAENRINMKEKFKTVSWHTEEGGNNKEADRYRRQRTKNLH